MRAATELNVLSSDVFIPNKPATIATLTIPAISAYSIEVAPVSSCANLCSLEIGTAHTLSVTQNAPEEAVFARV